MTTSVIEAKNLFKKYDEKVAVEDLSLSLKQGKCLCLLGPNGAGKTTTLGMLQGTITPDQGSVELFGESFGLKNRSRIYRRIGVVQQKAKYYNKYTVEETLKLFASFYNKHLPLADMYALLELEKWRNTKLSKLSGGILQRLHLATALVHDPDLLFLDEPTVGLDPQSRRYFWDLILATKKRGKSIILTTHFMDEAEYLADDLHIIDEGKTLTKGSSVDVLSNSGLPSRVRLTWVEGHALKDQDKLCLSKFVDQFSAKCLQSENGTSRYEALVRKEKLLHVMELFDFSNPCIEELSVAKPKLEDVFIDLTGSSLRDG